MRKRTNAAVLSRTIAMELRHSSINVVVSEPTDEGHTTRCRTYPWRESAAILNSDQGLQELTTALERIVRAEDLHGQAVSFLLDGEYCVTRYVRGTEQLVNDRLDELEARCSRYLLLGHGTKLAARHLDVASDNSVTGLLTVANQRTLETLSRAADQAGIQLASVGASIAVVGRFINREFPEDGRSGLLIRRRQTGVDVAIVDNGQLLLDVHPVRDMDDGEICAYVSHRIALLQRFFQHNSISDSRDLKNVFFCGAANESLLLKEAFAQSDLKIHCVSERVEQCEVNLQESKDPSDYVAVLAETYAAQSDVHHNKQPNLLEGLDRRKSHPLWVLLARTLWPIAAAVVLGVLFSGLESRERRLAAVNPAAIARHGQLNGMQLKLQREITSLQDRTEQLSRISMHLRQTDYSQLLTSIGGCLADDAGLMSVGLLHDGVLKIQGSCPQENDVYEFVDHLEQLPVILKAALSGTRSSEIGTESRTEFDIDVILRPVIRPSAVQPYNARTLTESTEEVPPRTANMREPNNG